MSTRVIPGFGLVALLLLFKHGPYSKDENFKTAIQFVDVAEKSGLVENNINGGENSKRYINESTGSGIAFFDYNNDGYPDIFMANGTTLEGTSGGNQPTAHLFRNSKNGTFADVTNKVGLARSGWGQGVCVGDYDNDGWNDLFLTYYGENALYRNDGGRTFSEVTAKAGVATNEDLNYSTGCAFLDYDRDGWLDLFVSNYVDFDWKKAPAPGSASWCRWKGVPVFCGPKGLPLSRNVLYRNNGNGTFADVSEVAGIRKGNRGYAFSILTADFRNCGWPDIYVACDSTPSLYYRNNGKGAFSEVGLSMGVAYSEAGIAQAGMGLAAGDYDGDGFLDIFKTNFLGDTSNLYRNNTDGTFSDRILQVGLGYNTKFLGWGVGFVDYDNDGWKDVFIANGHVYPEMETQDRDESYRQRKVLYRNRGNGTFKDVSLESGPGIVLGKSSRGVAFADFDNDGDMDIVINNQNDLPTLLRNEGGTRQHWVVIRAIGVKSNRAGIGTRVKLVAGDRSQIDEVRSGGSYISQNDLRLHFGLGDSSKIDLLEIRWPSGSIDRIYNLSANRILNIKEGVGVVEEQPIPTIKE